MATLPFPSGEAPRTLRLQQGESAADILAPHDHPLDQYQAAYPLYDRWLPELSARLDRVSPHERMVDIGANIGDTIAACRLAGCRAPFVAIEPSERYHRYLRANIERAPELYSDVQTVHCFIGEPGSDMVLIEERGTARSALAEEAGAQADRSVPTRAIDEVVSGPTSLLKVDTDGFDAQILRGSATFLAQYQPVVWAEAEVGTPDLESEWVNTYDWLSEQYPLLVAFDNFGFPLLHGDAAESRPIVRALFSYIRRHRQVSPSLAGPPSIYYLDLAFFPSRFADQFREFCEVLGLSPRSG